MERHLYSVLGFTAKEADSFKDQFSKNRLKVVYYGNDNADAGLLIRLDEEELKEAENQIKEYNKVISPSIWLMPVTLCATSRFDSELE